MADLRLYWLGPPTVELNGSPLRLEMRKTLALLAYLSLSPQPPTRETLATLFWPEYDQKHALSNLRRNLSSLANTLPPECLDADRERIGLQREGIEIDVDAFHRLLAQANDHGHPPGQVCTECISLLEQAALIYRGNFFEGFNLKDCPEFDDWQFFLREGLRAEYAGVLEKLAGYTRQNCEWEKAILFARSWVAIDRLDEAAQRMLMHVYYLSGQKSAALRQYKECERLLEQELGQHPEPETVRLYEMLQKEAPPEVIATPTPRKITSPADPAVFPLMKTKFFIPKVPRKILHRPRLVSLLNECVKLPLTLISASAGFGKTTLLAEWASQSKELIAWVSLDRDDNDPNRLLDYIVNAIQNVLPGTKVGAAALNFLHTPQPIGIPVIVGSLINDLISIPDQLVLVLDDYHNMDSPPPQEVINLLLEHQPDNLHLVISTRADPPLHLARLRANFQLSEIRTEDLRFSNDETRKFLSQAIGYPLSSKDIAFFEDEVEGWIVGIQMAALVMESSSRSQTSPKLHSYLHAFKGSQRYILDYLVEEVLNRQPQNIRTFLLRTSIMDKLCYQLCDSLLAGDSADDSPPADQPGLNDNISSQQILEFLERSNLFLVPMDDERKWFRYHHLFADLLHARLHAHEPRLEAALHKRAASWFAQNSYSAEAVKHALDSGDYSFASDLIEEYSLRLIWMNQIVTTLDWFKALPTEVIESRPLLAIYQAFMLARRGEFERVEAILAKAEAYIQTVPGSPKIDEYKILISGMRAFTANLKGEPEVALQQSLELSPDTGSPRSTGYYMAHAQHAVAYLDTGDLNSAERVFNEILAWARENLDVYYAILTNKELAEIWLLRGCPSQAEGNYRQMHDWIQQTVQEPALYRGLIMVYEANLLIERNELETACLLLGEDIESLLSVWRTSSLYIGYLVAANLYTSLKDFQRAKTAVEKAMNWVTSQKLYPRNRSTVQACQVNLWLAEGNLAEAQSWARSEFPVMPGELPFIRELDHLCLARILVVCQRWEEALDLLQRLSREAEAGKRYGRLLKFNILRALALDGLGRSQEALDLLGDCLAFACPEGYMRVFLDEAAPMKALIQHGLEEGRWQNPNIKDYAANLLEALSVQAGFPYPAADELIST